MGREKANELGPFAVFGVLGAILMVVTKDQEWLWTSAVASFAAIGALTAWYWRGPPTYDLDRAGDCSYYLGLCYTLLSLIYTLAVHFGAAEGGTGSTVGVIPAFGVALSSTLAGVIARIVLQSIAVQRSREEAEDVEPLTPERMRAIYGDHLTLAAQAMARELRTTQTSFAAMNRAAFLQAEEMQRRAEEAGERAKGRVLKGLSEAGSEAAQLAKAVQGVRQAMARANRNAAELANALGAASEAARESASGFEQASGRTARELGEAFSSVQHAISGFAHQVGLLEEAIARLRKMEGAAGAGAPAGDQKREGEGAQSEAAGGGKASAGGRGGYER